MSPSISPSVLQDPQFRSKLVAQVRRRVPAAEVEDLVQSALAEAALSEHAPRQDDAALQRWIWGVLRNKVADWHRRKRPDAGLDEQVLAVAPSESLAAQDWLRWVSRELPDGAQSEQTLEWMLREGDGESLESIADEENVPAPRVRQRVSRLRRHLRSRWAREVAALAAVGVALSIAWLLWHRPRPEVPMAVPETVTPDMRADDLRRAAHEEVLRAEYQHAWELLERAAALDPAGERRAEVRALRDQVARGLAPRVEESPLAPLVPSTPSTVHPRSKTPSPSKPTPHSGKPKGEPSKAGFEGSDMK